MKCSVCNKDLLPEGFEIDVRQVNALTPKHYQEAFSNYCTCGQPKPTDKDQPDTSDLEQRAKLESLKDRPATKEDINKAKKLYHINGEIEYLDNKINQIERKLTISKKMRI